MESKKISFGFMKTKTVKKLNDDEKKDYIDCVEEKSIKIIGVEKEEVAPLIIPMKPNTLVTAERLKQIAEEVEKSIEEDLVKVTHTDAEKPSPKENESLEQMAVRELLQDAKKEKKIEAPVLTLPVIADKLVLGGQKESTLEDYESVPIQDFGMAMLRGMGWTPGNEQSKYKQPQLRPKGLGLGADKVVKEKQKKNSTNDKDEDLSIVKNSFVKIVVGKYNGCYGKVVSLDEENGRVMVEISVKKETVSLSEFMMQAVSKSEFEKQSRVINADKYEEYKKNEASSSQKPNYRDRDQKKDSKSQDAYEKSSNGKKKSRDLRRNSSSSEERSKRIQEKKKYSSNESLSSISEHEKRKNYKKNRTRRSSTNSDSSDYSKKHKKSKSRNRSRIPEMKRDIDKKRKGKKKRRDRDRSPNYRKHKSKN